LASCLLNNLTSLLAHDQQVNRACNYNIGMTGPPYKIC
jgi:hypothetical protein